MALTARAISSISAVALASLCLVSGAHAERHYDCSKPGNANKAVCKGAAVATPAAAPMSTTTKTRHYDCAKPGNANKAACKVAAATPATAATPAATSPAPTPAKPSIFSRLHKKLAQPSVDQSAAAPTTSAAAASVGAHKGKSITSDPTGATGQCKDGTYTHAVHHSGACSRHGGVAKWKS